MVMGGLRKEGRLFFLLKNNARRRNVMAKIRTTVDFKPAQMEKLQKLSYAERRSRNSLVEEAVTLLLNQRAEKLEKTLIRGK